MASFAERMKLRAKVARESKDFAEDRSFAEDGKKFVPQLKKPSAMDGSLDRGNSSKNFPSLNLNQHKLPHMNEKSHASARIFPAVSTLEEKGKRPLKDISIISNKVSPIHCAFPSVKPVAVSPPEPGCLYPCLTGMEVLTDTEEQSWNDHPLKEQDGKENLNESITSESSESSAENFHIENMDSSFSHLDCQPKRQSNGSNSSTEKILNEMDEFLESAFCSDSSFGPSPAKSICNDSLETSVSTSFTYQVGSPVEAASIENKVPTLTHSVSFCRKPQNLTSPPVNADEELKRDAEISLATTKKNETSEESIGVKVSSKIKKYEMLVKTQENIISQAAGALSVCFSSPEFTNSTQRVEAERLLLVASHKKKAISSAIEKLEVCRNECLKPIINNSCLTLSNICLPIKSDMVLRAAKANLCHYLVGLVKSNENVFGTALVKAAMENLVQSSRKIVYIKFPNKITLPEITPDFKITIEIYDLVIPATPASGKSFSAAKKESSRLWITPKKPKPDLKLRKMISRSMLKSSNFKLIGSGIFTLNDVKSSKINLTKMSLPSLLEGTICFSSNCDVTAAVEYRGFLTMFDDISGFGAWHRRWCVLKENHLLYWKYPEDENSKETLGSIDLSTCTSASISVASRDICARQNTLVMECIRPYKSGDIDSQILTVKGGQTFVRYLLSADNRESRNEWCDNLNKVLSVMQQWKK